MNGQPAVQVSQAIYAYNVSKESWINRVKDRSHGVVRTALEKEGWKITADPYQLNVDDVDFEIDLAAEQLLAAELEDRKIAWL